VNVHVLERGNEDVAEGNDLDVVRALFSSQGTWWVRTFSCLRCFSSFSSRYVRFDKTGVLKGFIIFLIATCCPVS
jgi:hypothetical protein